MAVARGDEGAGNVGSTSTTSPAGSAVRRRIIRKPGPIGPGEAAPPHAPAAAAAPANPTPVIASPPSTATSTRLDDLYRLPMPKLFA